MNFDEYQVKARSTADYPNLGNNLWYPSLGLCGEAGEVAEIVKKIYRDQKGVVSTETREKLQRELGDVLYYIAAVSWELGLRLEQVAVMNNVKLQDRLIRGVIHGSGSDR